MATSNDQNHAELLQRALTALDDMEKELDAARRRLPETPIAVVGMGVRFPGGADDPDGFWELLASGRDAVTDIPGDRWDVDAMFDPNPGTPGKSYSRWGAFLENVDRFDPSFFGISPREAITMDPQQRLLLEVTWEAIEHAGIAATSLAGSSTGVFLGMIGSEYSDLAARGGIMSEVDAYFASGAAHSVAAGRLAYVLDLHGPAIAVDTACSSSLVAAHLACQSLRSGECDTALAGGVNLILSPDGHIVTSQARMMSFEGRCKTFDAAADGYVRGEGCGVILLKRLSDAVAADDRILGVIRGTAFNQDGRTNGLTAPNAAAQESVIRAALHDADLEPGAVGFVECHGTGTTLGDPIEIRALQSVYGSVRPADDPLLVQSVKTNIGHLEAAAGIAGLCKLLLAVDRGELPSHLHLVDPNPYIPWSDVAVRPVKTSSQWAQRDGAPRIGAVSSFGFSGTNVHMIVEQPPDPVDTGEPGADRAPEREAQIYAVSGHSSDARANVASAHADALGDGSGSWRDLAFTANTGRAHLDERLAVVADSREQAAGLLRRAADGEVDDDILRARASGADDGVVFLFTGQGSQSAGMGLGLYESEPVFRSVIDECADILSDLAGFDLRNVMFRAETIEDADVNDTRFAQPALFAYETAMATLLQSWGIAPSAVIGHSIGELAAVHVAGGLNLNDALTIVEARGRLMQSMATTGGMAAVLADQELVAEVVAGHGERLSIAAVNGARNIVISGEEQALESAISVFEERSLHVRRLSVSHAFHSAMMDPMLDSFEELVAGMTIAEPLIEVVSGRTGVVTEPGDLSKADYWRDQVRRPVLFEPAIRHATDIGYRTFLEVGPSSTLTSLAGDATPTESLCVAATRRVGGSTADLHRAVATLHVHGHNVDWQGYDAERGRRRRVLPSYRFDRQRYWHQSVGASSPTPSAHPVSHPLIGSPLRSPRSSGRDFEALLRPDRPGWLADHVVHGQTLVPATGLVEMMRLGVRHGLGWTDQDLTVVDLRIEAPLILDSDSDSVTVVQTLVELDENVDGGLRARVEVVSEHDDAWTRHASATVVADAPTGPEPAAIADPSAVWPECDHVISGTEYYGILEQLGVDYGPTFQRIVSARSGDGRVIGTLSNPDGEEALTDDHDLHPAVTDACLQLLGLALAGPEDWHQADGETYVPVGCERWVVHAKADGDIVAVGEVRPSSDGPPIGDLQLFGQDGSPVASISGVRLQAVDRASLARARNSEDDHFYSLRWRVTQPAIEGDTADELGRWVIVADAADAPVLTKALEGAGANTTLVDLTEATGPAELTQRLSAAGVGVVDGPADILLALPDGGDARSMLWAMSEMVAFLDRSEAPCRLRVLTRDAVGVVPGDKVTGFHQSAAAGIRRVAASECPRLFVQTIDLAASAIAGLDIDALLSEIGDAANDEPEVAWRDGVRYAPQLEQLTQDAAPTHRPYILDTAERGRLDGLELMPWSDRSLEAGEVRIDVRATGLNFRDVLNALGQYAGEAGALGGECTGIVTEVGSAVTRIQVGDRVMAVSDATFASTCIVPESMVVRQPERVSDAEAATIPIAFLTADYSLDHLAEMKAGERVLIHSATGGVGMAALQLARCAGAEIFATAGSEDKRAYLRSLGVDHVYDSRSTSFREEILGDTEQAGVDVVLNATTGETLEATVDVLSSVGRFVEIGMAGIWSAERFHERRPDAAYHVVYLGQVCIDAPDLITGRFEQLAHRFDGGELHPLPITAFDITESVDAFRFMAQARHMGKVVLTANLAWNEGEAGGTWIISGGLGGLGLSMAEMLVDGGADRVVLCSRRAAEGDTAAKVAMLSERADIRVRQLDIGEADAVAAMVSEVTGDGLPLKGVIHAAGVLDDGLIRDLTPERLEIVARPKLDGARNLASSCDPHKPDHFIMFSAGAALLGAAGQANYAAANAALDAYAHHRRGCGLPGLAIGWGPWSEVGMAAELGDDALRRWEAQGIVGISPAEGTEAVQLAGTFGEAQVAVMKLRWSTLLHHFSAHQMPPMFRDLIVSRQRRSLTGPADNRATDLVAELKAVDVRDRRQRLREALIEQTLEVLGLDEGFPIDGDRGLTDLGVDSLMAVELSNRLSAMLAMALPTTLTFEHPSVSALAEHLEELLGETIEFDLEAGADEPASAPEADAESEYDDLDDDELNEALLSALDEAGY